MYSENTIKNATFKNNSPMPRTRVLIAIVPGAVSDAPIGTQGIFRPPPAGFRKVVIATNIAESSITIDDVVFVIDSGKHKEKTYDAENRIACLMPNWVSRASAHQVRQCSLWQYVVCVLLCVT